MVPPVQTAAAAAREPAPSTKNFVVARFNPRAWAEVSPPPSKSKFRGHRHSRIKDGRGFLLGKVCWCRERQENLA